MSNKKQTYCMNYAPFKKWYKTYYGKEATKYVIAEILGTSYQSVDNGENNPNKTMSHLKTLSNLSNIPINKLMKKI